MPEVKQLISDNVYFLFCCSSNIQYMRTVEIKLIDGLDMWHIPMLFTGMDTQEIKSYTKMSIKWHMATLTCQSL